MGINDTTEKPKRWVFSSERPDAVVFIANKIGENFCARDHDVTSWEYDREACRFGIEFKSKPGFKYAYQRERVALYTVGERYSGRWYVALVGGAHKQFDHAEFLVPDLVHAPKIIRVTYENGACKDYPLDRVAVVAKVSASGLFRYLSAIEEERSRGGGAIEGYLAKRFSKLASYPLEGRASSVLLKPETATRTAALDGATVIYPFGCNLSQMQAVENALTGAVSLIEGPPGTGKTQTILNVIANLLIRNSSVLVASPNNSATDNVIGKLAREGLGFVVARLGNTANQQAFIENQPAYPDDIVSWILPEEELSRLRSAVDDAVPRMREVFSLQRQLATNCEQLRQWELQQDYFLQHFGEVAPLACRPGIDTAHLHELRDRLCELADSEKNLGIISKLLARFAHGIGKWSDFSASPIELELRISRTVFEKETARLRASIDTAERELERIDAEELLADVTSWSRALLRAELGKRYSAHTSTGSGGRPERPIFMKDDLRDTVLRNEYPVVTSTVNAAIGQCCAMGQPFDYVIIDESSQCSLTTGLLALASAKRAVVVGDTKQLPCVISKRDAAIADELFDPRLDERYRYSRESLLSCLEKCALAAPEGAIPVQLLAEHYRCHPAIIRFCNQRFYDGELVVMRDEGGLAASEALAFIEAEGHDAIMAKTGIPLWRLRTNAYKPDEQLEEVVRRVEVLADSRGSATCSNVSSELEG